MSDLTLAIHEAIDDRLLDVHTCFPARVVSYDVSKQTAELRAGAWVAGFPMPSLYDVPVVHPRAGSAFVHLPVQSGDWVLVLCSESSLARWKQNQTEGEEPDPQRHSLNGALALPLGGVSPVAGLAPGALTFKAPEIRMGSVSPSDYMALAGKVATELERVKADLEALKVELLAHVHAGVTTGPGVSGTSVITWTPSSPSSTASTVVKSD